MLCNVLRRLLLLLGLVCRTLCVGYLLVTAGHASYAVMQLKSFPLKSGRGAWCITHGALRMAPLHIKAGRTPAPRDLIISIRKHIRLGRNDSQINFSENLSIARACNHQLALPSHKSECRHHTYGLRSGRSDSIASARARLDLAASGH